MAKAFRKTDRRYPARTINLQKEQQKEKSATEIGARIIANRPTDGKETKTKLPTETIEGTRGDTPKQEKGFIDKLIPDLKIKENQEQLKALEGMTDEERNEQRGEAQELTFPIPIGGVGALGANKVGIGGRPLTTDIVGKAGDTYKAVTQGITKFAGKHKVAIAVGGLGTWAATKISEKNDLSVWAAVDNIASAAVFKMNKLIENVKNGIATKEEAQDTVKKIHEDVDYAVSYVNSSVKWNPSNWFGLGKPLMIAASGAQDSIEKLEENLANVNVTQEEQERAYFDLKQKETLKEAEGG